MSRVIKCNRAHPEAEVVESIVDVLNAGKVVVFPTETQYALGIRGDKDGVLEIIAQIKGRNPAQKPALFVKDMEMAAGFCRISEKARALAGAFLPGPLTLVMPARENPQNVTVEFMSEAGFGIRISSAPLVKQTMELVPFPVCATSANISGELTPPTVAEIQEKIKGGVELFVDGGPCHGVIPSTVVKVNSNIEVLRPGVISEAELQNVLAGV